MPAIYRMKWLWHLAESKFGKYIEREDALYESDFDREVKMKKQLEQSGDDLDKALKKLSSKKKK
jgi:hypothetical protein